MYYCPECSRELGTSMKDFPDEFCDSCIDIHYPDTTYHCCGCEYVFSRLDQLDTEQDFSSFHSSDDEEEEDDFARICELCYTSNCIRTQIGDPDDLNTMSYNCCICSTKDIPMLTIEKRWNKLCNECKKYYSIHYRKCIYCFRNCSKLRSYKYVCCIHRNVTSKNQCVKCSPPM